jgi:acetyl-CoA carboxylase/biotin carboxylase 1
MWKSLVVRTIITTQMSTLLWTLPGAWVFMLSGQAGRLESENPRLPENLAASKHKIVFLGPPGSAMRSVGDKISVPLWHRMQTYLPWGGVEQEYEAVTSGGGYVTVCLITHIWMHASQVWSQDWRKLSRLWPIMSKASEG